MSRDSYNQSLGNPVQRDRLPQSCPTVEFRCRPIRGLQEVAVVLCWGICLLASSLVAWLAVQRDKSLPTPPFLVIGIVAGAMFLLLGAPTTVPAGDMRLLQRFAMRLEKALSGIVLGMTLVTAFSVITVFRELPPILHQCLASIALGSFLRTFGQHYVGYCTTSPLRRNNARAIRRDCDLALRGVAVWPLVVVCLSYVFGIFWDLILATLFVAAVAAAILARSQPANVLRAPWAALVQWCTYNLGDIRLPGLYIGSAGSWLRRLSQTSVCCFLMTACIAPSAWRGATIALPLIDSTTTQSSVSAFVRPDNESTFSLLLAIPVLAMVGISLILCWPILIYATSRGTSGWTSATWHDLVADLRESPDPIERECIFVAFVLADGSPVLVPRSVFNNHAHFLGDSGSGKTSLGLSPFLEQMIHFGDCSFIVLDLKGDSLEVLAAMKTAAESVRQRTGSDLPLKHFSIQTDRSTFAFNPLAQPFWTRLAPSVQSDILCAAFGLNYGTDYGASWFTAGNSEVCNRTVAAAPEARTFRQLADALNKLLTAKGANKMDPDIRSAGLHVQLVLKRLAEIEALNVDPREAPSEVGSHAIDLANLFQRPELLYFQLPSMLMPSAAPEIARIVIYSLLSAATMTSHRRCQVFLVIDEFQRIVSDNLESILQLARSMNVGVILANQSMQDLQTRTTDLIPALESNCRFRQWFAVSSSDDRMRVVANSGEMLEEFVSTTVSDKGPSYTVSQKLCPRLSQNDVILATDHAKHSILCLKNGAGYAQYGGFPLLVESDFHITSEEYESRRRLPWPAAGNGAFIPRAIQVNQQTPIPTPPSTGPRVTTEFFGRSINEEDDHSISGSLARSPQSEQGPRPRRKRKGGKS